MTSQPARELLILRHAKSSWDRPELSDHERPLNTRGERDAPRIGRFLRDHGLVPDLIMSSTARRAVDTATAVAVAAHYDGPVMRLRSLYHARPAAYLAALRSAPPETNRVMLVGHNPGIEELVQLLGGRYERMPTAALARFSIQGADWEFDGQWPRVTLLDVWRVKELSS